MRFRFRYLKSLGRLILLEIQKDLPDWQVIWGLKACFMDVMIMKKEIKFSLIKTTSKFGDLMKEILDLKKIF